MDQQQIINLIIQLISGAAGGNIAGTLLKNINLGTLWNSVAGILGGGLGGQILKLLTGAGAAVAAGEAANGAGIDIVNILQQVASGGVGGGVLMAIIGFIKKAMAGQAGGRM